MSSARHTSAGGAASFFIFLTQPVARVRYRLAADFTVYDWFEILFQNPIPRLTKERPAGIWSDGARMAAPRWLVVC